jgi:hypothetical protein
MTKAQRVQQALDNLTHYLPDAVFEKAERDELGGPYLSLCGQMVDRDHTYAGDFCLRRGRSRCPVCVTLNDQPYLKGRVVSK